MDVQFGPILRMQKAMKERNKDRRELTNRSGIEQLNKLAIWLPSSIWLLIFLLSRGIYLLSQGSGGKGGLANVLTGMLFEALGKDLSK